MTELFSGYRIRRIRLAENWRASQFKAGARPGRERAAGLRRRVSADPPGYKAQRPKSRQMHNPREAIRSRLRDQVGLSSRAPSPSGAAPDASCDSPMPAYRRRSAPHGIERPLIRTHNVKPTKRVADVVSLTLRLSSMDSARGVDASESQPQSEQEDQATAASMSAAPSLLESTPGNDANAHTPPSKSRDNTSPHESRLEVKTNDSPHDVRKAHARFRATLFYRSRAQRQKAISLGRMDRRVRVRIRKTRTGHRFRQFSSFSHASHRHSSFFRRLGTGPRRQLPIRRYKSRQGVMPSSDTTSTSRTWLEKRRFQSWLAQYARRARLLRRLYSGEKLRQQLLLAKQQAARSDAYTRWTGLMGRLPAGMPSAGTNPDDAHPTSPPDPIRPRDLEPLFQQLNDTSDDAQERMRLAEWHAVLGDADAGRDERPHTDPDFWERRREEKRWRRDEYIDELLHTGRAGVGSDDGEGQRPPAKAEREAEAPPMQRKGPVI